MADSAYERLKAYANNSSSPPPPDKAPTGPPIKNKPNVFALSNPLPGLGQAVNNAVGFTGYLSKHGPELMNALEGVAGRGVLGAANSLANPNNSNMLGDIYQAVTHPGATTALARTFEHRYHLRPIKGAAVLRPYGEAVKNAGIQTETPRQVVDKNIASMPGFLQGPARLVNNAGNFIAEAPGNFINGVAGLASQSGLDLAVEEAANAPALAIPELDAGYLGLKTGAKIAGKYGPKIAAKVAPKLAPGLDKSKAFRAFMTKLDTFYGVNRDLSHTTATVIRGSQAMSKHAIREAISNAQALVDKHKDVLESLPKLFSGPGSRAARRKYLLDNPETAEIIHELDRVAWLEGTQDVRNQMLTHGNYKPPEDIAHLPPGNTLHTWDPFYFPTNETAVKNLDEALPPNAFRQGLSNAANYNLPGGEGEATDDVVEQVRARLANGYRNVINAKHQRRSIIAAIQGAHPGAEMSHVDLNDPSKKRLGNIFQPYKDAELQAKLTDIGNGNMPFRAFTRPAEQSGINRDIEMGGGGRLKKVVPLGPLEKDIATKKAELSQAGSAANALKSGVSSFALNRQKAVSEAATEAQTALQAKIRGAKKLTSAESNPELNAELNAARNKGYFKTKIHKKAALGEVKDVFRPAETAAKRAEQALVRSNARLANAKKTNEVVMRVNDLIDKELARSGHVLIPKSVEELLFPIVQHKDKTAFAHFADIFRDATFAIPYVHGWNLLTQTAAHGYKDVLPNARKYQQMIANGDKSIQPAVEELRSLGQAAEYSGHDKPLYANLGNIGEWVAKQGEKGQKTLDSIDHGLKIAVMEELKKKGLSGPNLASALEDIYGNPTPSVFVQAARAIGSFYPGWRLSTLPKTIYNATKTAKGRQAMTQMNMIENWLTQESEYAPNQSDYGTKPTEFNLFPGLSEADRLLFGGPQGAANYLKSLGSLGVAAEVMDLSKEKATDALANAASGVIPVAPQILQALKDVYNKDPMATVEDALRLLGPQIQAETGDREKNWNYREKMKYLPQSYEGLPLAP